MAKNAIDSFVHSINPIHICVHVYADVFDHLPHGLYLSIHYCGNKTNKSGFHILWTFTLVPDHAI